MWKTVSAKKRHSSPPIPGRISIRHGMCAKGCFGASDSERFCASLSSAECVDSSSSCASSRSSLSLDWSMPVSSPIELLAVVHAFRAAATPAISLARLEAWGSNSVERVACSWSCSLASFSALWRRALGKELRVSLTKASATLLYFHHPRKKKEEKKRKGEGGAAKTSYAPVLAARRSHCALTGRVDDVKQRQHTHGALDIVMNTLMSVRLARLFRDVW